MKKEAEENAEADKTKKERVEVQNTADSMVFQAEKLLQEQKDKISEDDKKKLEEAVKATKDVIANQSSTKETIEESSKKLTEELQRVGQQMYQKGAGSAPSGEPEEEPKTNGTKQTNGTTGTDKAEEGEVVN